MNKSQQKLFLFFATALFVLSCSNNKTVTRFNSRYTDISTKNTCDCVIEDEVKNNGRYKPPLSLLLDYKSFESASNWTLHTSYDSIRFSKMNSNSNGINMTIHSKEPIRLTHKNKALTLNFTPCTYPSGMYKIPYFSIDVKNPDNRDLNEDFDYSAYDYFEYLISGTNSTAGFYPEDVLRKIIPDRFYNDDYSDITHEFKQFIKTVNQKYKTTIKIDKDNPIDSFVTALENSQIDLTSFILKEFVLTENSRHQINQEEKNRLRAIFSTYNELVFKRIDFKLKHPLYDGYLSLREGAKRMAVEINTGIIRKWDNSTLKPVKDSTGNDSFADIMVYTNAFRFSNFETDRVKIDSLCTSTSEITDTGILLEFDIVRLSFPQKEMNVSNSFSAVDVKHHPFFKKAQEDQLSNPIYVTKNFDSTLTNFTGLLIPAANIQVPIKEYMLAVKGKNIILNNHFISGAFDIKRQSGDKSNNQLVITTNKSPIKISVDDLIDHLNIIGLDQVQVNVNEGSITVFFKKSLGKAE